MRFDLKLFFSHRCRDFSFVLHNEQWVCPICGAPYSYTYPMIYAGLQEVGMSQVVYWQPWKPLLYLPPPPITDYWRPWQDDPYNCPERAN